MLDAGLERASPRKGVPSATRMRIIASAIGPDDQCRLAPRENSSVENVELLNYECS